MKTEATQSSLKPQSRVRPPFIIAACLVLVLAILCFWQNHPQRPVYVPPPGPDPCDLVLLGVRPDFSDDLYAPDGHFLGFSPTSNIKQPVWNADRLQRDFIFEVPVPDDSFKIIKPIRIRLNGHAGYAVYPEFKTIKYPHSTRVVASVGLPRLSLNSSSAIARMQGGEPVRTVDIEVKFFAGERNRSDLHFSGPFQTYQTYEDDTHQGYTLSAHHVRLGSSDHQLYLRVTAPPGRPLDRELILYRPDGTWKITAPHSRNETQQGNTIQEYLLRDSGLEQITHIGLNEMKYTRVFRNIVVHYPRRPARTFAPFLDDMASAFNLQSRDSEALQAMLTQRRWSEPFKTLNFLPQARGQALLIASRTVREGLTVDQLTEAQQQSLRNVLSTWLGTELEPQALALGLWGHWSEFVQPSIDRLTWSFLERQSEWAWARSFAFQHNPSDAEIRQVATFLGQSHTPQGDARRSLIQFLRSQVDRPAAQAALLDLAQGNRPWIWTHLIQPGSLFTRMVADANVPPLIWQRALALDVIDSLPDNVGDPATAYPPIATWLTPEFAQYDPNQFVRVVQALDRHGDMQRDTPLLGRYLQMQLVQWSLFKREDTTPDNYLGIQKVVMLLNRWYHLHLGALGRDLNVHYDRDKYYWRDIARTAITWVQTRQDPMYLRPGQSIDAHDIRLIWYDPQHPEQSVILLWSTPPRPTERFDYLVWSNLAQSYCCLIHPDDYDPNSFELELTGFPDVPNAFRSKFNPDELPGPLSIKNALRAIGGDDTLSREDSWVNDTLIWERAQSQQSILNGTRLYERWQQEVVNPADPNQPRPRVFMAQIPES